MAFIQKHKYIKLQKEGSFFGLKIISYNKQHNQENKKKEKKKQKKRILKSNNVN